jgi:hypothetical protein
MRMSPAPLRRTAKVKAALPGIRERNRPATKVATAPRVEAACGLAPEHDAGQLQPLADDGQDKEGGPPGHSTADRLAREPDQVAGEPGQRAASHGGVGSVRLQAVDEQE